MLMLTSVLRLGSSKRSSTRIDMDSHSRIMVCIRVLLDPAANSAVFTSHSRDTFKRLLAQQRSAEPADEPKEEVVALQADQLIVIRQLKDKASQADDELGDDADLTRAVGAQKKGQETSKLNRVHQLTGFAGII